MNDIGFFFLGLFCSIISGLLYALGVIFQKKGVNSIPKIEFDDLNSLIRMFKNQSWIFGVLLSFLGTPFYIIAQGLIGIALSQPLSLSFQLIFTVILGCVIVREKLSKIEILGFLLLLSTPFLFYLSDVSSPSIMLDKIIFFQSFIFFCIVILMLCGIFIIISIFPEKLNRKENILYYSIIAGFLFGFGNNISQLGVEMVKIKGNDNLMIGFLIIGFSLGISLIATIILQKSFQGGKMATSLAISAIISLSLTIGGGISLFNQKILMIPYFLVAICFLSIGVVILLKFQAKISHYE